MFTRDFWSEVGEHPVIIDLSTVAAKVELPDAIVPGEPIGYDVVSIIPLLKVRLMVNTSGSTPNGIKGDQTINVKKSEGEWGTDDMVAIDLPDKLWTLPRRRKPRQMAAGDIVIGHHNLKDKVNGVGIYNLRFEKAQVNVDYLRLVNVQTGLRIFWEERSV